MSQLNFQQDVIAKSYEKPVVVDFWAPWCGPCRILGPVIEQLASEQADRWSLVKVNTEEEYELAEQYRIMSIPNVKMFFKGEVIGEFMGALPRHSIERWLDAHIPDERKEGLEDLLARVHSGDAGAVEQLGDFVAEHPDVQEARLTLAQAKAFTDASAALGMVEDIQLGNPLYDAAEDVRTLVELMTFEADASPVSTLLDEARQALRDRHPEEAITKVIDATTADRSFAGDLPRRAAIALFRTWGHDHPLTKNYRWRFDMVLY